MTITATIAGAISMIAQFGMFFGGGHRDNNSGGPGMIGTLAMVILAPIAAMLVQMAISRTREYAADDLGARIAGRPEWLASALRKLDAAAHAIPNDAAERNPATAHMFIVNPLTGQRHGQPVLDPSGDREPHRGACSSSRREMGGSGFGRRAGGSLAARAGGPVESPAAAAALGADPCRVLAGALRRCQRPRKRGMTSAMPDPHRSSRHADRRRPASPRAASPPTSSAACCARSAPLDEQLEQRRPRRAARARPRPGAAPSSRRCCAGSARLRHLLAVLLEKGLPQSAPQVEAILLIGAAQILFLDVPDHASVDLSVRLAQADRHASHYSGLVNARAAKARARRQEPARRRSTPCCSTRRTG